MELKTVHIELDDEGAYAVVYRDVLRKTSRLHQEELRKYMKPLRLPGEDGLIPVSELEKMDTMPVVNWVIDVTNIDNDAINEIFIFNQVVDWSFGPVDRETLENKVSREQYNRLVAELDRMYKPIPLPYSATQEKP